MEMYNKLCQENVRTGEKRLPKYLRVHPFIVLGIYLAVLLMFLVKSDAKKDTTYVETTAVVVDCVSREDDGDIEKAAVYEFEVDDVMYRTKGSYSKYSMNFKDIGETVAIKYNPQDPNEIFEGKSETIYFIGGAITIWVLFIGIRDTCQEVRKKKQATNQSEQISY